MEIIIITKYKKQIVSHFLAIFKQFSVNATLKNITKLY